jgi:enamine deaminase RidA (YjgF/YER057c/UK114 family)
MEYKTIEYKELSVKVQLSVFTGNGAAEYHAIVENCNNALDAETQYRHIAQALSAVQSALPANAVPVLKRYFVSDAVNHASLLPKEENVAVSIVQQPPLNGSKASVWAYWMSDAIVRPNGENAVIAERPACKHLFNMQLHDRNNDEFVQTKAIFQIYGKTLARRRLSLKDNVVRTWIYVQGVDTHYAGMVKARKLHFHEQGLTEHTHYLASTGIEGKYLYPETTVLMDVYAIEGIVSEQITYLKGATHLNPTHQYGVTFERATAVDYGDRRHVFVSGTASIDNRGEIVFPFNIGKQMERTFENIGVLLAEGGCEMCDLAQLIVYLRDTADYNRVSAYLAAHYPAIPAVIVWAPVCRPGWLVEIECIAVKAGENGNFAAF